MMFRPHPMSFRAKRGISPLRKAQGGQVDAPRHSERIHVIPAEAGASAGGTPIQMGGVVGHPPLTSLRSFAPPCAVTKGGVTTHLNPFF